MISGMAILSLEERQEMRKMIDDLDAGLHEFARRLLHLFSINKNMIIIKSMNTLL
jgi:hypothetical protein